MAGLLQRRHRRYPAELVHLGVLVAGPRWSAGPAGGHEPLQDGAGQGGVLAGVVQRPPASRRSDVSAVRVGADALAQLIDHVLTQARTPPVRGHEKVPAKAVQH